MLNIIWVGMMVLSVLFGILTGRLDAVVAAVTINAKFAFELALGLVGIMSMWMGLMKIAEEAGLMKWLAHVIAPVLRKLFPDVPHDHPALASITLNIAANMLGITNASTPLGLKAMQDLETLNKTPGTATDSMVMFLAINTSSVQLVPTTAIAYLAAAGATYPTIVITTGLLATTCSTLVAIIVAKSLARLPVFRIKSQEALA